MATVVTTNPDYSPDNFEAIEICSHCNRPLCPHCLNHAGTMELETGTWTCSNPDCKHEFRIYFVEV